MISGHKRMDKLTKKNWHRYCVKLKFKVHAYVNIELIFHSYTIFTRTSIDSKQSLLDKDSQKASVSYRDILPL